MKKKYIEPTLLVHKVVACQMICNSINGVTGLDGVTISEENFTGGASVAREASFSDDEWFEE